MKLVVTYWAGDEYEGGNVNLCVEYESKEQLLFDLELKVEEYLKLDFDKRYSASNMKLGIHEVFLPNFIRWEYTTKKKSCTKTQVVGKFDPPRVQTLEEWWNWSVGA